jgi:hypothetical protein
LLLNETNNSSENQIRRDNTNSDPDKSENNKTLKSQKKRYCLIHRRFGYYKSEVLRYFHEITNRIKKIQIPAKEKQIYKLYKISKIEK